MLHTFSCNFMQWFIAPRAWARAPRCRCVRPLLEPFLHTQTRSTNDAVFLWAYFIRRPLNVSLISQGPFYFPIVVGVAITVFIVAFIVIFVAIAAIVEVSLLIFFLLLSHCLTHCMLFSGN